MKKMIVVLGAVLVSASAFAAECPDFSGRYELPGTLVSSDPAAKPLGEFRIEQHGCASMTYTFSMAMPQGSQPMTESMEIITDGVLRQLQVITGSDPSGD